MNLTLPTSHIPGVCPCRCCCQAATATGAALIAGWNEYAAAKTAPAPRPAAPLTKWGEETVCYVVRQAASGEQHKTPIARVEAARQIVEGLRYNQASDSSDIFFVADLDGYLLPSDAAKGGD